MRTQQQQLLVLLVAGVSAMPTEIDERDLQECQDVAMDILPNLIDLPTPDPTLIEFIAEQTQFATITDECLIPAVTGSMSAEYSSWMSSLSSWQQEHTAEISSLFEACSDVPEISSSIDLLGPAAATICSEVAWETPSPSNEDEDDNNNNTNGDEGDSNSDNNDDSNGNGDESDATNDNSSETRPEDAAPRVTGAAVGAFAIAAVVAAVL